MIPIDSVFDRISSVLEGHPQIEVPSQSRITAIQNQNVTDGIKQKDPTQFAEDSQQSQGPGLEVSNGTRDTSERAELDVPETPMELSGFDNLEITMEPSHPPPEPKIGTQPVQSEKSRPSRNRPFLDVLKRRVLDTFKSARYWVAGEIVAIYLFTLRLFWSFPKPPRPLSPPVERSGDYDVRSLTRCSKLSP